MAKVNEGSVLTITVTPINENGVAFTPNSARYRLDDKDSSTEVIAWTDVTPSTTARPTSCSPARECHSAPRVDRPLAVG